MPIIYAVVARGSRVLCEYAATSGNFATIARKIAERVQSEAGGDARRTYEYDAHMFHLLIDEDVVFMCMWGSGGNAFEGVLREQMAVYSGKGKEAGGADVEAMQGQLSHIKSVMVDNIDKVLDRGEKINLLVDKTDNLHLQANKFSKASTSFRRQMAWRNIKVKLMIAAILILALYLLVGTTFCGGLTLPKCRPAHAEDAPVVAVEKPAL